MLCSPKPRETTENEKYYRDAHSDKKKPLPSLFDEPNVKLSCIIPAFDESKRLPTMLKEAVDYLSKQDDTFELIIVDDGSRDNTIETALTFAKENSTVDIRVLALEKNRGKGGAVTQVQTNNVREHSIKYSPTCSL